MAAAAAATVAVAMELDAAAGDGGERGIVHSSVHGCAPELANRAAKAKAVATWPDADVTPLLRVAAP